MKLRNKKTGEILSIGNIIVENPKRIDCGKLMKCSSLAELNEEWEDYEEPKEYWYINFNLECIKTTDDDTETDGYHKLIGNYFETKEEAEKAAEKLKAWKRLKDKGFRFDRWNNASSGLYRPIWFYFEKDTALEDIKSDLDLLFLGGEE